MSAGPAYALVVSTDAPQIAMKEGSCPMPTYRMVYGDNESVVRETFNDVEVEREDGWVVFFRGSDAILRVQEDHVQSLDLVENDDAAT
jgi:hypothetical protein